MSDWRLAKGIKRLFTDVNAAFPNRDKSSDGHVADAAHGSSSDHSPRNPAHPGVVTAADIDENNADVGAWVMAVTVGARDPRVKYVIYEGRIYRNYRTHAGHPAPWSPQKYTGPNAHGHHVHVSLKDDARFYDDERPWTGHRKDQATSSQPKEQEPNREVLEVKELKGGETGLYVSDLLLRLKRACAARKVSLGTIKLDDAIAAGTYNGSAKAAVNRYRKAHGLPESGLYDFSVLARVDADLS